MIFKDFEGFKKIKNEKGLDVEKIYSILEKYPDEMGKVEYCLDYENQKVIVSLPGKYHIEIRVSELEIIIERILEDGRVKDRLPSVEKGKKIKMAQADRMIDQIYDLINDYMDDGIIKEVITYSKRTLRMQEKDRVTIKGLLAFGISFDICDTEGNLLYEATNKTLNNTFSVKKKGASLETVSVNCTDAKKNKFTILEKPFQITTIEKDEESEKTRFISKGTGRKITILADYTDNHYVIELDDIVIGAVDSLDPQLKKDYRIEINSIKHETLVIASAIIIDAYSKEHNVGV